jgi:Beta-lactamase superfamily domain
MIIPIRFGKPSTLIGAGQLSLAAGLVLERFAHPAADFWQGFVAGLAGDTYHGPFMAEIGRRFRIDVALLPVTTYRIPMTMGEKSAVLAARDLNPATVIPIHLGVRPRSPLLRTRQTPLGFESRLREAGLDTRLVCLDDGGSWEVVPTAGPGVLAGVTFQGAGPSPP